MTLEQETALLALIIDPLDKINRRAIEEAARQLRKIGTLSAKNINQLNMQYEAGLAASEIMAAVARAADTTVKQVYEVLQAVAKTEYAASEPLFAFRGIDQIPYKKNATMRRNVRAIARKTSETMTNISMTRGQNVGLKTREGFLPLNKAYAQIVDEGIQSVVFGGKSYDEATRGTIKTFGGSGLRVQYDSGNTRRIDSAVRMNTLDGIRAVNAEVQREISETIGTDKVEISVHLPPLHCAPDHLEYQGLVMTRDELDRLNGTTLAYPKRAIAIGALNCRHYTLAFLDGISKPRYTPEQLAEIARAAKETREITYTDTGGNERAWKGTIYEATQVQRQMETALRYTKEAHNAAQAAGNKTLSSELQREITARSREYKSFSKGIGLKPQEGRAITRGPLAAADAVRNTGEAVEYNPKADFGIKLDGVTAEAQAGLSEASGLVAKRGGADGREHMYLVNLESGALEFYEGGSENEVGGRSFWDFALSHESGKFAFVHNHNTDGYFSETDMRTLLTTQSIKMFVAVRLDGVKYIAEKTRPAPNMYLFDDLYKAEIQELTQKLKQGIITPGERTRERERIIVDGLLRDYTKGLIELDGRP